MMCVSSLSLILLTLSMNTGQSSSQAAFIYTSNQCRLSYYALVPSLQQGNLPPLLWLGSLGTELAQKQRETCILTEPKEPAVLVRAYQPKFTEEATTWDSGKGKSVCIRALQVPKKIAMQRSVISLRLYDGMAPLLILVTDT